MRFDTAGQALRLRSGGRALRLRSGGLVYHSCLSERSRRAQIIINMSGPEQHLLSTHSFPFDSAQENIPFEYAQEDIPIDSAQDEMPFDCAQEDRKYLK